MTDTLATRITKELHASSLWVVRARWYYALLAFLLGLIATSGEHFSQVAIALSAVFVFSITANFVLFFYLKKRFADDISEITLWKINVAQVVFDVLFIFFILVATGSGLSSFVHVFFFVPIIVSMIFFGFRGAMTVAAFSGLFLLLSEFIENGILMSAFSHPSNIPVIIRSPGVAIDFAQSGVVVLIYLLIGFLSGNVSRMLSSRDSELRKEFAAQEENVKKMSELTREFELSSKLLVRRDIELTIANERMTALDAMKTEIISVAAHQLRTPLSGIKWMMNMLLVGDVGPLDPKQYELIQRGAESNERLIRLVNDMLTVDRLESGRIKYMFIPTQIQSLLERVLSDLLPIAHDRDVHVISTIAPNIAKLYLDPERITDMITNLIHNAIKYSKSGSTVTVILEKVQETAQLSIHDDGIGIPSKDKGRVFSRFFRAANAMQHFTEGSGLGLSIAQSVALRHGGKIWFESEEGHGTTFFVKLPLSTHSPDASL